jgi:hypothetical protein
MKLKGIANCGKVKKATKESAPNSFAAEITGYIARKCRIELPTEP